MTRLTSIPITLLLVFATTTNGQVTEKLDFDVPFQPADDFRTPGVAFAFTISGIDSTEAFVGSFGPGTLSTVSDPSLTGNSTGILTLMFDRPTPILEFGVALSTADALSPGVSVELFDALGESLGIAGVDTTAVGGGVGFSEAAFGHSAEPISKAVIDFADEPGNFAFDNLVYEVPEPSALLLVLCAAGGLLPLLRSRLRW